MPGAEVVIYVEYSVALDPLTAKTDGAGEFEIRTPATDHLELVAEAHNGELIGYAHCELDGKGEISEQTCSIRLPWSTFAINVSRKDSISGKVVDNDGRPLPGVKVLPKDLLPVGLKPSLMESKYSTVTDEAGTFTIKDLPAGHSTRLRAILPGWVICEPQDHPESSVADPNASPPDRTLGSGDFVDVGQTNVVIRMQREARIKLTFWSADVDLDRSIKNVTFSLVRKGAARISCPSTIPPTRHARSTWI